jgi:DNA invertase Pin-like site-specific DNA recombinase
MEVPFLEKSPLRSFSLTLGTFLRFGFFLTTSISASSASRRVIARAMRSKGKRLLEAVEKGDVIITAKLDRAFRSAADALGTLEELKDQGVGQCRR